MIVLVDIILISNYEKIMRNNSKPSYLNFDKKIVFGKKKSIIEKILSCIELAKVSKGF